MENLNSHQWNTHENPNLNLKLSLIWYGVKDSQRDWIVFIQKRSGLKDWDDSPLNSTKFSNNRYNE